MAEWRTRNYVPDSDDDEENGNSQDIQSPVRDAKEPSEEGFIDIDGIADIDDSEKSGQPTSPRKKVFQVGDITARRKSLGAGTAKGNTIEEDWGNEDDLGQGRVTSGPLDQRQCTGYNDDDVDELQQDHYPTTPAAQLGNELSTTIAKETSGSGTSTPLQEPIALLDALTKLPKLPSSPLVPPQYQPSPAPSSPLSEPPPTPPTERYEERAIPASPLGRSRLSDQRHFTVPKVVIPLIKYSHGQNGVGGIRHEGVAEAVQQRSGRALRERNPIQLHPYALEGELYRQSLKARGLKPVRFVQTQEEEDIEADGYSQLQETNVVEDVCANRNAEDGLEVLSSSPPRSVDWRNSRQPEEISKSDEEDFPDVDTIPCRPLSGTFTQGFKRRKTAHTYGRSGQGFADTTKSPSRVTTGYHVNEREQQTEHFGSVFDVPPSPSLTGSSSPPRTSAPATDGFRYPIGLPCIQLPTPITSSEPRRWPVVENDHQNELEDVVIESQSGSEKSSATDVSLSENEEAHELQKVRRKIRGVLPASWLKLDLKTQNKKPSNNADVVRDIVSPARKKVHRGVARPVTASKNKNLNGLRRPSNTIEISDDSSSDRDAFVGLRYNSPIHQGVDDQLDDVYTNFDTDLPDIMEDNRIDHMLPPSKRTSTARAKATGRRTKVAQSSSSWRKPNHSLFRKHRGSYTGQSSMSNHVTRDTKESDDQPRYSPPRLSILDVTSATKSGLRTVPPFVRIATRTVRSRLDAGRHSPSRKFLRLATNQDTAEVQETLHAWRAGSIGPKERAKVTFRGQPRTPLTPNSGNRRLSLEQFDSLRSQDDNLTKSPVRKQALPLARVLTRQPRKTQTSLRTFLEQQKAGPSQRQTPKKIIRRSELGRKTRGIQAQILSTLQNVNTSRPALLESYLKRNEDTHTQKGLRDHLVATTHTRSGLESRNPVLERFLQDSARRQSLQIPKISGGAIKHEASSPEISNQVKERTVGQGRKRHPRYLDTKTASFKQYSEPLASDKVVQSGVETKNISAKDSTLPGLGPFGTQYTTTFDIVPLPTGMAFPKNTFLGSGQFCKSLITTGCRDLESPANSLVFQHCHTTFDWGSWTDMVSSQLGWVIEQILQILREIQSQDTRDQLSATKAQEVISLQQCIIQYIAENLSFLDPIDRVSCVQRCTALISTLTCNLDDFYVRSVTTSSQITSVSALSNRFGIQVSTRNLVIINQLRQIAKHKLVQSTTKDEIQSLLATISRQTLNLVFRNGFEDIRRFLRSWRNLEILDWDDQYKVESAVVTYHIVKGDPVLMATFSRTIQHCIMEISHGQQHDARVIDHMWLNLFTLLPLFELDAGGILKTRQRFGEPCENWAFVKRLLEPVFEVYMVNSGQSPTYNDYFRAISGRCFRLIKDWGWRRCEVIIGAFFDFYARNNLAHLQHEECHGSPTFLEQLDKDSAIELAKEDRCFHILLKIIGVGLRSMRGLYPSKKIRDIAWRLMPNHGRSHPKDEAVRQEDLDALRNHHDLLCTLYWASPPGFRPRLSVIQNLVDVEASHKEACHISIRAWSNLVRYQVSTTEPVSSLEPFVEWHNDLVHQILRQHGSARIEVEAQAKLAESSGGQTIPHDIRESTIGRNQRQVESVLIDALVSLRNALESARDIDAARTLLTTSLSAVFDLFDAKQPRIDSVIIHALDVLLAFTSKFTLHEVNDDSQDFGDWSAFEDDNAQNSSEKAIRHIEETMLSPMSRLMSNCFGADAMLDDMLLIKLVQTWVAIAQVSVVQGIKSWNDYLSPYGHDSWLALRDTEQTRKFTTYFLATLIGKEHGIYQEYKTTFIAFWMSSLLERESLLKYQHMLTEAVLNADRGNPLLANLPFWADTAMGRFVISASDFRERRLSLISCILSNMRESMDFTTYHNLGEAATQKHEYTDLLKRLMATMKHNYQELGTGSSIKGAYVDFVHAVVGFLQQHTADFCPIDRFFTDSSAFPLPATDPTYVVGRLRNYQLRLQDSRTPKQLSVFIQTVSERAAVDGQQRYLVEQMRTAVSSTNEIGDPAKPTLRSFLLQAIFPAYIESSFSTSCGWLLAAPVLQAAEGIFGDVIQDMDGINEASVNPVIYSMAMVLRTMRTSMGLLVDHSVTIALLPTLSYLSRLSFSTHRALCSIRYVKSFATFAIAILSHSDDPQSPLDDDDESVLVTRDDQLAKTRSFTTDELQDTLKKNWTLHDGRYYVIKGSTRREVVPQMGSFEEERQSFMAEAQRFFEALRSFPALDDDDEDGEGDMPRRSRWSGVEDCIF